MNFHTGKQRHIIIKKKDLKVSLNYFQITSFSGIETPKEGQRLQWMDTTLSLDSYKDMQFLEADISTLQELFNK